MLEKLQPGDEATIGYVEWTTEQVEGRGMCVVRRVVTVAMEAIPISEIPALIAQREQDSAVRLKQAEDLRLFSQRALEVAAIKDGEKVISEKAKKEK